jgi:hypothetical protein
MDRGPDACDLSSPAHDRPGVPRANRASALVDEDERAFMKLADQRTQEAQLIILEGVHRRSAALLRRHVQKALVLDLIVLEAEEPRDQLPATISTGVPGGAAAPGVGRQPSAWTRQSGNEFA